MKREINPDMANIAAIDIGSNAARILIKQVNRTTNEDGTTSLRMKKLQFLRIPLRLGMDVFTDGKISQEREKQLMRTIKIFRQLLILYNVADYRACATSALRDAKNGSKILKKIRRDLMENIEIITGDEEAQIIRDNYKPEADGNFLFVDVGGGSTELSLVANDQLVAARSFNIGTIRLLNDRIGPDDWQGMIEQVRQLTDGYDGIQIIGSGGNINKLYRLAPKRERKKDTLLVATLQKLFTNLSQYSVEERMAIFDLRPDRADVIVPAAQIFLMVAGITKSDRIIVPTVGLADGIINELVAKNFPAETPPAVE